MQHSRMTQDSDVQQLKMLFLSLSYQRDLVNIFFLKGERPRKYCMFKAQTLDMSVLYYEWGP